MSAMRFAARHGRRSAAAGRRPLAFSTWNRISATIGEGGDGDPLADAHGVQHRREVGILAHGDAVLARQLDDALGDRAAAAGDDARRLATIVLVLERDGDGRAVSCGTGGQARTFYPGGSPRILRPLCLIFGFAAPLPLIPPALRVFNSKRRIYRRRWTSPRFRCSQRCRQAHGLAQRAPGGARRRTSPTPTRRATPAQDLQAPDFRKLPGAIHLERRARDDRARPYPG